MDTEGLNSIDKNTDFDSKLFSISIICSSYFIYNSIGCIDETSISQLSLVTHLVKNLTINKNEKSNEYELSQYAPKFLWVLRDFMLEVRDVRGRLSTPSLYLESTLTDINHIRGIDENGKKIRESIVSFFRSRECITLVRPCNNEEDLKIMDTFEEDQLRYEFVKELNRIRDKIFKKCSAKIINGVQLNSRMFAVLLQNIITSINDGDIPSIKSAWENLIENELAQYLSEAIELYDEGLKENFECSDKSKEITEINKIFNLLRDRSISHFNNVFYLKENFVEDNENLYEDYKNKLIEYISEKENKVNKINLDIAKIENSTLFNKCVKELQENIGNYKYNNINIEEFNVAFDKFIDEYSGNLKNIGKIEVLSENINQLIFNFYSSIYQSTIMNNQVNIKKIEKKIAEHNNLKEHNTELVKLYENKIKNLNDVISNLNNDIDTKEKKKSELKLQLENYKKEEENLDELIITKQEEEKDKNEKIYSLEKKLEELKKKKAKSCFCC